MIMITHGMDESYVWIFANLRLRFADEIFFPSLGQRWEDLISLHQMELIIFRSRRANTLPSWPQFPIALSEALFPASVL